MRISQLNDKVILEQNSVFTVSTYHKKSREISVTEISPDGEIYERRAIIGKTADGIETGVLTTYHFKVYLALIKFWEDEGRPVNDTVHFTILKMIKCLGLADSGSNYERIKRWLRNLRQIPLTFVDSFYVPEMAEHVDLTDITILNHLRIYEHRNTGKTNKTRGYGEFQFDRYILQNLVNNHSHPLRLDVINSLKKHQDISILLYTYIDRNLAFKDRYEVGLEKLFEHLDLSQNYVKFPSHRKAKLDPVLDQLRGKELSTGILSKMEVVKTADGSDYKLVCHKKPFSKKLKGQISLLAEDTIDAEEAESDTSELPSLLIGLGLTEKQAKKLASEIDHELINLQIEYLPFRVREYQAQCKRINESAILYDSICDNWSAPKGYFEAEKQKEHETQRLEQERLAQLEREEQDRAEQEKQEIDAYKATLAPGARAKLKGKALEKINNTKGIKKEFITEMLIEIYENEILKLEMG